jgi:hypothetical protein
LNHWGCHQLGGRLRTPARRPRCKGRRTMRAGAVRASAVSRTFAVTAAPPYGQGEMAWRRPVAPVDLCYPRGSRWRHQHPSDLPGSLEVASDRNRRCRGRLGGRRWRGGSRNRRAQNSPAPSRPGTLAPHRPQRHRERSGRDQAQRKPQLLHVPRRLRCEHLTRALPVKGAVVSPSP